MQYLFLATHFIAPVYFCDHSGQGFKLSTSIADAKRVSQRSDADNEAARLSRESGMHVTVRAFSCHQESI